MRQRFAWLVNELLEADERLFLLLTDISRDYFRRALDEGHPRVVSAGIMEQTAMSAAAGVALEGFIPVVHSITPFIVHRPYEQIRVDFVFQRLGVNIVTTGGSYDYAEDGFTHHAPDDVPALLALPGVEIVVPGTPAEFESLFRECYANGAPTVYRLSSVRNSMDRPVAAGRLEVVRRTEGAPVAVVVGPMLERVLEATGDLALSVTYCTSVAPFDRRTLRELAGEDARVVLVEPYHAGALIPEVVAAVSPRAVRVEAIGVPRQVTRGYGTVDDHDRAYGLTATAIRERLTGLLADW